MQEDGTLTQVGEPAECKNPTFLCSSHDGKFLYASNEIGKIDIKENGKLQPVENSGLITSYEIDQKNGGLKKINEVFTGAYPCHIDVNSKGDQLISAFVFLISKKMVASILGIRKHILNAWDSIKMIRNWALITGKKLPGKINRTHI